MWPFKRAEKKAATIISTDDSFQPDRYSTASAQKYAVTPDEQYFFSELKSALTAAHKSSYISTTRLADGSISVNSRRAYLGKINLQDKKTWMQYMINTYDSDVCESKAVEEYIRLLRYWVKSA